MAAALLGGLVLAGCGGGDDDAGGDVDSNAPVDLTVHGDDELQFDKDSYSLLAGTRVIELVNDGSQPHTLLFEKKDDVSFDKLSVASKGKTDRGSVAITPGTYTIYCDIVGHRSAGMEATLVVN